MAENCTAEQAEQAVGYLRNGWGGFPIEEMLARQYRRLFLNYPASDVNAAIDLSITRCQYRPSPAELASFLHEVRKRKGIPHPTAPYRQSPGPFIEPAYEPHPNLHEIVQAVKAGDVERVGELINEATA